MLHEHWVDSFDLIRSFCDKYVKLNHHTLNLILIYECYMNYIRMFKTIKKFQFSQCFKELSLNFKFDNDRGSFKGEHIIQKQLATEIIKDLNDVFDNIYKYVMLGNSAISNFCKIYDYILCFYIDNENQTKQQYIEAHFFNSGKNLSFELMKRSGFVNLKQTSLKMPALESNASCENINLENNGEQTPSQTQNTDKSKDKQEIQSKEDLVFDQLNKAPNDNTPTSIFQLKDTNKKSNIFLEEKQPISLLEIEQQQYNEQDELQQTDLMDIQVKTDRNLNRIYKILNCLNEDKDYVFLFTVYIPEFQKQFGYKNQELIVIFVDNILTDINEQIKILIQYKNEISKSSFELILSICQELQKFDKITNFVKECSYYEITFPLLELWIENYKNELAQISIKCLEKENWENQENSGSQIFHNSKNSMEFVSILFKSIENLIILSCSQSFSFTKIINYLIKTILLDTCDYYCDIMLSSLQELQKSIQETQFLPLDKYSEGTTKETASQQENNLTVLRAVCLRLGNLRFLSDQINTNSYSKSTNILELMNDKIKFTLKKVSEIIGKSFVHIFLKNFFDCYLQELDVQSLNTQSIKEFSCTAFYSVVNLLPHYRQYFSLMCRRIPKSSFNYVQNIIIDQFEKQMIACLVDINKLERIQNQKKFGLFIQSEIDFCRDYLKAYFSEGFNFQQVYKIAILYQKETSDLIIQIENPNLPEFDHQLAFRIVYMRRKTDIAARSYTTKNQHRFIEKKTFNLKKFLDDV